MHPSYDSPKEGGGRMLLKFNAGGRKVMHCHASRININSLLETRSTSSFFTGLTRNLFSMNSIILYCNSTAFIFKVNVPLQTVHCRFSMHRTCRPTKIYLIEVRLSCTIEAIYSRTCQNCRRLVYTCIVEIFSDTQLAWRWKSNYPISKTCFLLLRI